MSHICPDNDRMTPIRPSPHIQSNHNTPISITDLHHHQQKSSDNRTQVYKRVKNSIMELAGDPSYICLYNILPWIDTYDEWV